MYRIVVSTRNGRIKTHTTNTSKLARAIATDLEDRFVCSTTITHEPGPAHYDPGGMMLLGQKVLDLGMLTVNEQHLDDLKDELTHALKQPVRQSLGRPYYKLHGQTAAVLTPQEAALTLALITLGELNESNAN